jgi:hypothetical protein
MKLGSNPICSADVCDDGSRRDFWFRVATTEQCNGKGVGWGCNEHSMLQDISCPAPALPQGGQNDSGLAVGIGATATQSGSMTKLSSNNLPLITSRSLGDEKMPESGEYLGGVEEAKGSLVGISLSSGRRHIIRHLSRMDRC